MSGKPLRPSYLAVMRRVLSMRFAVLCLFLMVCSVEARPHAFASGDALWWRVNNGDLNVAVVSRDSERPVGRQKRVRPHYNWGFRIRAGFSLFGNEWTARYLWYLATRVKKVSAEQLWISMGIPPGRVLAGGSAKARTRWRHQTGDAEWGCLLGCPSSLGLRLALQAGIHYAWVDHKLDASYSDGMRIARCGEFFGFGPKIALEGEVPLWRGIVVLGRFGLAALVGGERSRFYQTDEGELLADVWDPMKGRVVPFLHGLLGVAYHKSCGIVTVSMRIGYEAQVYGDGVSRLQLLAADSGVNTHTTTSFGLSGLFCGLGICF